GARARARQPRRAGRGAREGDDGAGRPDRARPARRAPVHEAQPECRRERHAPGSARPRSLAPHAHGHDRRSPGGGEGVRRQAGAPVQGPLRPPPAAGVPRALDVDLSKAALRAAGPDVIATPVRPARYSTPRPRPAVTAIVAALESSDIHLRVVLESPANASPTTGMTGAPQPMTVHPPVASPKTLETAPSAPPEAPARGPQPAAGRRRRR